MYTCRSVEISGPANRYGPSASVGGKECCRHSRPLAWACRACETLYLEWCFYEGDKEAPQLVGAKDYGASIKVPREAMTQSALAKVMRHL
jgi:hypothetical protein